MSHHAEYDLKAGNEFPYDGPVVSNVEPDWALRAARGIFHDLNDRCGIKDGFLDLDVMTRQDIVTAAADIIRLAASNAATDCDTNCTASISIVYKDLELSFSSHGDSLILLGMLDVAIQRLRKGVV